MKTYKTISQENLAKKVLNLNLNKNTIIYQWMVSIVNDGCMKFNTVYSSGRYWKTSKLMDYNNAFKMALSSIGMKYREDNLAPKGGRTGVHIFITTKIK